LKRISILIVAALFAGDRAWASGLQPPIVGHPWSGPVTADAAATFWNPAMLAGVRAARVEGNMDLVLPFITYTRERRGVYQREDSFKFKLPLEPGDLDPSKTGVQFPVSPLNTIIPAGSLFAAVPVSDRVTLGFGFFGLAGAIITFPDFGPARYQIQEASVLGMALTAGAGVKVTEWLKVGATAYFVAGRAGLRKVADLAETDLLKDALARPPINQPNDFGASAPTGVRELAVLSRPFTLKDATAYAGTFAVGLAFEPRKDLTIGLTYVHRVPLRLKGRFFLDMNDDFFTQDLASQGLRYPPLVQGDAYVEFPIPSTVKLGLAYQASESFRLQLLLEYVNNADVRSFVVTLQSPDLAQPSLGVPDVVRIVERRNWRDTVSTLATGIFKVTRNVEIGLSLGYQSSAVPDATMSLASPDGNRIVGSAVSRLSFGRFELSAGATVNHILRRTVTASEFDKGNGTYDITLLLLSGSVAVKF
jgi:long-chain fatty acid transport protein